MFVAQLEIPEMTLTQWRIFAGVAGVATIFYSVRGLIRLFRAIDDTANKGGKRMPGMLELIARIGYWEGVRSNSIVVRAEGKEVFVDIFAPTGEKLDTFDMWPDGFVSQGQGTGAFGSNASAVYPPIPEGARASKSAPSNNQSPEVERG